MNDRVYTGCNIVINFKVARNCAARLRGCEIVCGEWCHVTDVHEDRSDRPVKDFAKGSTARDSACASTDSPFVALPSIRVLEEHGWCVHCLLGSSLALGLLIADNANQDRRWRRARNVWSTHVGLARGHSIQQKLLGSSFCISFPA